MKNDIQINEAKKMAQQVLIKHGYNQHEAEVIGDVLIYGSLRESSQGLNKLFGWHAQKDPNAKEPKFETTSEIIMRCNANRNSGAYANSLAIEQILPRVKKLGIAVVGVYNFNSSSGAISYYTKRLAESGYVGIMFASADPIGGIAPIGRAVGVFGTNPLSISVPYKNGDITLDMSTAKYTWGDLVNADMEGKSLTAGFAFNNRGEPTTDPKEAMEGTVGPFDGSYKGLGLALMIQILAGGLVGSVYAQSDEKCDYGSLIIAIDPKKLAGQSFLEEQMEKLILTYKHGSNGEIFLPGEKGDRNYKLNSKRMSVSLSQELIDKMKNIIG